MRPTTAPSPTRGPRRRSSPTGWRSRCWSGRPRACRGTLDHCVVLADGNVGLLTLAERDAADGGPAVPREPARIAVALAVDEVAGAAGQHLAVLAGRRADAGRADVVGRPSVVGIVVLVHVGQQDVAATVGEQQLLPPAIAGGRDGGDAPAERVGTGVVPDRVDARVVGTLARGEVVIPDQLCVADEPDLLPPRRRRRPPAWLDPSRRGRSRLAPPSRRPVCGRSASPCSRRRRDRSGC